MINNKKILAVWLSFLLTQMFMQGAFADTNYRVKSSDNLNKIADKHYEGSGLTKSQILVGIYASNPKSFKNGNINKLLKGQKLVLPDANKIDQISPQEANLVLSARKKRKVKKRKVKKRRIKKRSKSKRVVRKKVYRKKTVASQNKNNEKLDKLEKESELLRKRLDALLAEKSVSDNKLKELESSLQAALKKTAASASKATVVASTVSNNEIRPKPTAVAKTEKPTKQPTSESELVTQRANEKLRETNELLEKNLQESKKEIANRTRDSLAKEHAIKVNQSSNTAVESISFDTSNKYLQWALLSLLLFPLVWFAKRFMGGKKEKEQPAWVTDSEGHSAILGAGSEQIDTHYQEAPVESSIKLDVASAYLESGDTAEAVEILNEILAEGNAEQKEQAQDLLDRYS